MQTVYPPPVLHSHKKSISPGAALPLEIKSNSPPDSKGSVYERNDRQTHSYLARTAAHSAPQLRFCGTAQIPEQHDTHQSAEKRLPEGESRDSRQSR